jgi:hypothetical protein
MSFANILGIQLRCGGLNCGKSLFLVVPYRVAPFIMNLMWHESGIESRQ